MFLKSNIFFSFNYTEFLLFVNISKIFSFLSFLNIQKLTESLIFLKIMKKDFLSLLLQFLYHPKESFFLFSRTSKAQLLYP